MKHDDYTDSDYMLDHYDEYEDEDEVYYRETCDTIYRYRASENGRIRAELEAL
jgi:hypothetical protein